MSTDTQTPADVFRNGAFEPDDWVVLDAEAPLPEDGRAIVPLARYQEERESLRASNQPLGILISPGEKIEDVADDLGRFSVLAIAFPAYTDGRGYSTARLARERYGFAGELRAVGNVLADQVPLMARCGFDAFVVTKPAARKVLEAGGAPDVPVYYQPTTRDEGAVSTIRPWMRRSPPGVA
ncbi:DUF934 domain-containing protein [Amorphus orientalis]|uniref:Phosphoadenosine phosphosulfate reductase n=1 Tax=Amorphus orientalis TaxID=649198 RepID=A0AAE4ARJ6_9HYPH|nr:DUF934 domain-containing protein [Amorphus orientalis]MDQ0315236.1 phosphoadenosine phosphosulfate reductase [Amorphus orientalis]